MSVVLALFLLLFPAAAIAVVKVVALSRCFLFRDRACPRGASLQMLHWCTAQIP